MARFEVFHLRGGLALDCQADILHRMPTRFVVPLELPDPALIVDELLNPVFRVRAEALVMVTQLAGTVRLRDLGEIAGVLSDEADQRAVQRAIDLLTTGI